MIKIEFFLKGKSLGASHWLIKGSSRYDRDIVARAIDIKDYDEFILDDGRIHCKRVPGYIWLDHKMEAWETIEPPNSRRGQNENG